MVLANRGDGGDVRDELQSPSSNVQDGFSFCINEIQPEVDPPQEGELKLRVC
jgi:hypothetical protein